MDSHDTFRRAVAYMNAGRRIGIYAPPGVSDCLTCGGNAMGGHERHCFAVAVEAGIVLAALLATMTDGEIESMPRLPYCRACEPKIRRIVAVEAFFVTNACPCLLLPILRDTSATGAACFGFGVGLSFANVQRCKGCLATGGEIRAHWGSA